jgi:hypothetical protein
VWKRRLIEEFAILTVGDGLIEFLAPKSPFCKVHAALASRVKMRRIIATSMKVSLLCTFRS